MLRTLGSRAWRRAGAVAPVGGRFALVAECQYERRCSVLRATTSYVSSRPWAGISVRSLLLKRVMTRSRITALRFPGWHGLGWFVGGRSRLGPRGATATPPRKRR